MMDSAERQSVRAGDYARADARMRTSRDERRKSFCLHYVEGGAGLSRRLKIRAK